MLLPVKGLSKNVSTVEVSSNFDKFDVSIVELVFKMTPFKGYMFSSDLGALTCSQTMHDSLSSKIG
jgi:hypothetical protein